MTAAVWVQLAVGVATALVALFVMRSGLRTTTKVDEAARRTEWWRRTQWAIELVLSDEERRQTAGVLAVNQLMLSPLADQESDVKIAEAVMAVLLPGDVGQDDEIEVNPPPENELDQGDGPE